MLSFSTSYFETTVCNLEGSLLCNDMYELHEVKDCRWRGGGYEVIRIFRNYSHNINTMFSQIPYHECFPSFLMVYFETLYKTVSLITLNL